MTGFKIKKFPRTRLATIDISAIGQKKHHVAALIEVDVTRAREILKGQGAAAHKVTFTAWLIKVIGTTLKEYEQAAGFLYGKQSIIIFDDINISLLVEKELNGRRVPIPLVIEKVSERSAASITGQIHAAKEMVLTKKDIVLQNRSRRWERIYYILPGFIRRAFWIFFLKRPSLAFKKMGNVAITSIGMMGSGRLNGWFLPISIHPICFGISRATKKPVVIDEEIVIREILNLTILADHDVIDGAPMARFISELAGNIEEGKWL